MAFEPRTFDQILADMIAYVQANTEVSDFSVGSVVRTLLEASALEDDEQYFQMVQLLEGFRISTARGEDLDRRLADFGLVRREAKSSTVRVRFFDANLKTDQLTQNYPAGTPSIQLFNSSIFPNTGFPYNIRVGEGTTRSQNIAVTANDTATNTMSLATPLSDDFLAGDRVSLVTGSSSRTINAGTTIQAPANVSQGARTFQLQEPAFIVAGNFYSNEAIARSQSTGTQSNIGSRRLTQFQGGAPFPGAGVLNFTPASGGANRESDSDFRRRALQVLQSLSRGTPLALRTASIGVTDPSTGNRTTSANVIEDFVEKEVRVYVDDGTGYTPVTQPLPSGVLNTGGPALGIGSSTIQLVDSSEMPSNGWILIDEDGSLNPPELLEYTSKNDATNTISLDSPTTFLHDDSSVVLTVDIIEDNAENGRRRFSLKDFPVVRGTDRIFIDQGFGWEELTPVTDYVLNKGTGEFQLVNPSGANTGAQIVATYTYYTNLIAAVQRVLEGDIGSPVGFPGVKAAGIFLSVEAPTLRRVQVIASIATDSGFLEEDVAPRVQVEIERYINSLKIGDDVILSKIVDVAHNVAGVRDIILSLPVSNVTILENEIPVPFDTDGTSLVTIL